MKTERCALALAVAFGVSSQAGAACTQNFLAGKWSVYVQGAGSSSAAIACNVVISSTGALSASSACASTNGLSSPVRGSIKLLNANICDYSGTVTLTAFALKEQFLRSTLAPDRSVLSGVGYEASTKVGYVFTMIRLP